VLALAQEDQAVGMACEGEKSARDFALREKAIMKFAICLSALLCASALTDIAPASATELQQPITTAPDADTLSAIYEHWTPLAEALGQARAERNFIRALRLELDPEHEDDALEQEIRRLSAEQTERLRAVFASYDPRALMEEVPQSANILADVVRLNPDPDISRDLLEAFAPVAETSMLDGRVYDSLLAMDLDAIQSETMASERTSSALTQFQDRYSHDIETIRFLGGLRGRDVFIRGLFVPLLGHLPPDQAQILIAGFGPRIGEESRLITQDALAVLAETSFAELHERAPTATSLIAALVHHGGSDEEKRHVLALIEPLALAGRFNQQRYALMYDRQAESEGRPQRYGSQDACVNGMTTLYPVEDIAHVDERRAEMGMEPLAEYRASLIRMYGERC